MVRVGHAGIANSGHNGTKRSAIMAVEPGFLSLQWIYGAAQVSGTMDPPRGHDTFG
jgi:hypothetical protein